MEDEQEMLTFFKAMADATRLKIIGLLAQREYSGEELAALLGLKASTISHHLSRLAVVGLVSARAEGYYSLYRLEEATLRKTHRFFSRPDLISVANDVDADAYDRKVIADFSRPNGSLKEIPAQRKKLEAILRHVMLAFEPGKHYSEKQVNLILARFHEDTASLRRELVGFGSMKREGSGGAYWRVEKKA